MSNSATDQSIWGVSTTAGYDMSSSYTPNADIYRKQSNASTSGRYAGVEMDQLSYQMMALANNPTSNNNDTSQLTSQLSSQLSSPSINSNGYFVNQNVTSNLNDHNTSTSSASTAASKLNSYNKWTSNTNQVTNNNVSNYSNYLNQQTQAQQQIQQQHQQHSNNNYQQSSSASANQIAQQGSYHNDSNKSNYNYLKQVSLPSKDTKPQSSSTNQTSIDQSNVENFKMKIQLKDIIISKLELELEKERELHQIFSTTTTDSNGNFEVPKNQEQLYNKLVETIQVTKKELDDTKSRLEALVTAIALNPNTSSYKNGRYDEEEIAHKVISKMQILTEENEELSKMLSYGKSKEKDIEIGLLRQQNTELREKISKLESKLNEDKP